jgi:ornithine cyclodeaminase
MRMITADEVDACLNFPDLVAALREAFRRGAVQPVRHHHAVGRPAGADITLLLMPAWTDFAAAGAAGAAGDGHVGVKIVTVSPDNNALGKPAVMGLYLLLDGRTGEPQALIDGQRLTLWRTAAASALAATYLARPDASRLLVVGAGALAPFLARAHAGVRPIREIRVWNRSGASAERVAEGLRAEGHRASATTELDTAAGWADVISCATISPTPLVKGALLRPGAHVDLVGAFTPHMRESDDEAVRRASVFVDTRGGALKEAGDIVQPLAAGVIGEGDVRADLAELSRGTHPGRMAEDEITLFKSVGAALEDLAAGILVFERAGPPRHPGTGTEPA